MRTLSISLLLVSGLALTACAKTSGTKAARSLPAGAVAGSMAADRDGDGIVDGYYTSDGVYHANYIPPQPVAQPAVYRVSRRGERG